MSPLKETSWKAATWIFSVGQTAKLCVCWLRLAIITHGLRTRIIVSFSQRPSSLSKTWGEYLDTRCAQKRAIYWQKLNVFLAMAWLETVLGTFSAVDHFHALVNLCTFRVPVLPDVSHCLNKNNGPGESQISTIDGTFVTKNQLNDEIDKVKFGLQGPVESQIKNIFGKDLDDQKNSLKNLNIDLENLKSTVGTDCILLSISRPLHSFVWQMHSSTILRCSNGLGSQQWPEL